MYKIISIKQSFFIVCLLVLTGLCTVQASAQNADTAQIKILCAQAIEYVNTGNQLKALIAGKEALDLAKTTEKAEYLVLAYNTLGVCELNGNDFANALTYHEMAFKYAEEDGSDKLLGITWLHIGNVFFYQESYTKAIDAFLLSVDYGKKCAAHHTITEAQNLIAVCYYYIGEYEKSLLAYQKALHDIKQFKLPAYSAQLHIGVGNLYLAQNNFINASKEYDLACTYAKENKQAELEGQALNNLGHTYTQLGEYDKALEFSDKALKVKEKNNAQPGELINSLINIGNIFSLKKEDKNALEYYNKALAKAQTENNKGSIALVLINIGIVQKSMKKPEAAIRSLEEAINLCRQNNRKEFLLNAYEELADVYSSENNFKKAFESQCAYTHLKDSMLNESNARNMNELQVKYETEKKETQIELLNTQKKTQSIVIYAVAIGLIITVFFSFFLIRTVKNIRKSKQIIEQQNIEVERQRELADQRRLIAEEQRQIIAEKQKEIIDSIHYASHIQQALLTRKSYIKQQLAAIGNAEIENTNPDFFILYKPKDIVAGDFYWALSIAPLPDWDLGTNEKILPADKNLTNIFYLCTADCTGHGVPGAFMSMLNISYLNENVVEKGVRLPHHILNAQRKKVVKALNPKGDENSKDGMDCSLCAYDFNKMILHFSAANNPLWLVRYNEEGTPILTEYKADKMPVGLYEKMDSFTLRTIEIKKGDIVYTFTDGYADQFGGPDGKKFKYKQLQQLILSNAHMPLREQKKIIDTAFENWKGSNEQIDDVCVIGVKV